MSRTKIDGGYGCVYIPAFPCKGLGSQSNSISKLFKFGDNLEKEFNKYTELNLQRLDPRNEYYIRGPVKCLVDVANKPRGSNVCAGTDIQTDFVTLNFPNGGATLTDVAPSAVSTWSFYNQFKNIIAGLRRLNDNSIFHADVKPPNIVRTDNRSNYKLIDFGLSRKITPGVPIRATEYGYIAHPNDDQQLLAYRQKIADLKKTQSNSLTQLTTEARNQINTALIFNEQEYAKLKYKCTIQYYEYWPVEVIFLNYPAPHPSELKRRLLAYIKNYVLFIRPKLFDDYQYPTSEEHYEFLYGEYCKLTPLEIFQKLDTWSVAMTLKFVYSKMYESSNPLGVHLRGLIKDILGGSGVLLHKNRLTMTQCLTRYEAFMEQAFPRPASGAPVARPRSPPSAPVARPRSPPSAPAARPRSPPSAPAARPMPFAVAPGPLAGTKRKASPLGSPPKPKVSKHSPTINEKIATITQKFSSKSLAELQAIYKGPLSHLEKKTLLQMIMFKKTNQGKIALDNQIRKWRQMPIIPFLESSPEDNVLLLHYKLVLKEREMTDPTYKEGLKKFIQNSM
jgi:serine/threonine protein kinase